MKILEAYNGKELPKVETERLILRQRTVADAEDIFDYASRPEVSYPAGYGIVVKGTERIVGSVDFNHRHEDDVLEIGYVLHPDYWGRGYVPEAVSALVEIAFTILSLHKVEIGCYDYNKQSQRVAEKLGFTLESRIRDRKDIQGRRCGDLRYGLLRSEWEERNC